MFQNHCASCDRDQLIFPSQISGLANTERGILVSYVCWCGADQTLLTGRRSRPTTATLAA